MKKKRLKLFIFFMGVALVALSSCQNTQKEKDMLTFVFVPGVADPFYYTMERGITEKAQELGVNLIVAEYPQSWDPEAQILVLETTATQGDIDLILIAPTSVDVLITPLKKLYDQGIQIITVDTSSTVGRVRGFKAGIAEFPDMELVGVDYNSDIQEIAQEQTLATLQKHPDLVGVFGVNVFSAQGAYRAIVDAGLTGAVKIASWDATKDLINALKEGQVDLVLAQKPAEMGALAVEWGCKFFKEKAHVPKKVIPGFEFFTRENVNNPDMQQFIYQ